MARIALERAVERVTEFFEHCAVPGHAIWTDVRIIEAVERADSKAYIIRCEVYCWMEFGKQRKQLVVDFETGDIKALREWECD
jgi:hypothetical protein